jgi:hypothetical protein
MARRIAGSLALIVFVMCLMAGAYAGNEFSTIVTRAVAAMAGTFVVGLIIGAVGQKMIDENLLAEEQKLKKLEKP